MRDLNGGYARGFNQRWGLCHHVFGRRYYAKGGFVRDLNAAVRQFRQALSNERWLEEDERAKNP